MKDESTPNSIELVRIEPGYSGSSGGQVTAPLPPVESTVAASGPASPGHLGAALTTFADSRTVAVGMIAVAAYRDASERSNECAEKLEKCRETAETLRRELAVLKDRESQRKRHAWYTEAALIFGGVIAGAGLPLMLAKDWGLGVVTLLAGTCLVLFGLGVRERGTGS